MSKTVITEFGNPILRKRAKRLLISEIKSSETQDVIAKLKDTVRSGEYGVGLAAPQIGVSLAISVIAIKPTPSRPDAKKFDAVIINPKIVKTIGDTVKKWEGCMSFGVGDPIFAQTDRYETISASYYDENAVLQEKMLSGLEAHVFQHELDHLNGVLFVDRVKDPNTWMNANEYKKRITKSVESSDTISTD